MVIKLATIDWLRVIRLRVMLASDRPMAIRVIG